MAIGKNTENLTDVIRPISVILVPKIAAAPSTGEGVEGIERVRIAAAGEGVGLLLENSQNINVGKRPQFDNIHIID